VGGGVRIHDDPGKGPVDACLPGSGFVSEDAVLVVAHILAQVPDIPAGVLGVPVEGVFDQLAVKRDSVVHDRRRDSHDLSPFCEHFNLGALDSVVRHRFI